MVLTIYSAYNLHACAHGSWRTANLASALSRLAVRFIIIHLSVLYSFICYHPRACGPCGSWQPCASCEPRAHDTDTFMSASHIDRSSPSLTLAPHSGTWVPLTKSEAAEPTPRDSLGNLSLIARLRFWETACFCAAQPSKPPPPRQLYDVTYNLE